MRPALSSTTPTSWRTSSVFRPGPPSAPPKGGGGRSSRSEGPAQTEAPHHLGPRARSVSRPTYLSNLATLPDILASLRALVPHTFAGALHRTQATSDSPAGTTALWSQPRTTRPRRSPRTRSETGYSLRNPLPSGLPRAQSMGTVHPAWAVASVAPDAERIADHEGVRENTVCSGYAP